MNFSGGKDSTYMLLEMIRRNMRIDAVVFADTTMEFPPMYEHIDRVEQFLKAERGIPVTRLRAEYSFEQFMFDTMKGNTENLVYKMCYQIWEDAAEDKKGSWLVSWALGINVPTRPKTERFYFAGDKIIAEQNKKRYDTFDAAQKYIQGRFDLYVGLFRELRPPVPDKFKRHFYINGCLLPEYTVAPPELTTPDEKAVESLLDYLDEGDTAPPPPAAPVDPAPQSPAKPQRPTAPPTAGRPKRPPAKPKRKSSMSR